MTDLHDWILIIDDDEDIRDVIEIVLGMCGYKTVGAFDGLDGLERLRTSGIPSLILLDLMMPRLNGVGFAREVKSQPSLRDVPIIVLSGDHAASEVAASLGASGYLIKPVGLSELLETVKRFVKPGGAARDGGAAPDSPAH